MSKPHFAVVGDFGEDPMPIQGRIICVVTEDGRPAFEITIGENGISIEIRAQSCVKVNDTIYDSRLVVRPVVSNVIQVLLSRYEDR